MISFRKEKTGLVRRYSIVGGRRFSNYWWSLIIFLGGCGFLLTGVSSYYNQNLLVLAPEIEQPLNSLVILLKKWVDVLTTDFFNKTKNSYFFDNKPFQNENNIFSFQGTSNLPFFPQGLVLSFYGFLGLCFSFHLWFTLLWKIGGGFNEFNGKEKYVRIFRWGRPGKNRRIDLKYTNELIESIKVEFVPRPALFLRVKGEKQIPLTRLGEFIPLEELEAQAAELTNLLQVPLEIAN